MLGISYRSLVPLFAVVVLSAGPTEAKAKALQSFDCDVPPNHYSSLSQEMLAPFSVSGLIKAVEMRSGVSLPVAGVLFKSSDGDDSIGFQLVAPSKRAKQFDVIVNTTISGDFKKSTVAQISTSETIPFRLSVQDDGAVTITLVNAHYSVNVGPQSKMNGMVLCSTGQFKFTDLAFSSSD